MQIYATKDADGSWGYGYDLCLDLDKGALQFHIYDESDDFCFARLLVCPEIRTIYITEMFAYTLFHIDGYMEYKYMATDTQHIVPHFITKMIELVHENTVDFDHVKLYTPKTYAEDLAAFKSNLAAKLVPFSGTFPSSFLPMLARSLIPQWVRAAPGNCSLPPIKELMNLPTADQSEMYSASMAFFDRYRK